MWWRVREGERGGEGERERGRERERERREEERREREGEGERREREGALQEPYVANAPYDSICSKPCLLPYWTRAQWAAIARVTLVFSSLSFSLMFFLSLHYLLDPACRNSTMRFQLYSVLYFLDVLLGVLLFFCEFCLFTNFFLFIFYLFN
jgi:hypothetical protein